MHKSERRPVNEWANNHNPTCAGLMAMAERELGAFISAVAELYGSEQANLAAEDWLDELESMDTLPGSKDREWRLTTIAASARLAGRMAALVAGTDTKVFPIPSSNCFVSCRLA
jgi:hypothetical protein